MPQKQGQKTRTNVLSPDRGDSANALALAGMAVVGSKFYGSYPLKGNIQWIHCRYRQMVEECRHHRCDQIHRSKTRREIQDVKSLRYGTILVMSDQDTDGFHIRGLVFSPRIQPELLLKEGFIKVMRTPLVKAFAVKVVHQ